MKKFFVILACKMIRLAGKLTGRGSSLPGQIALKLDPNILSKIKMPPYIVAVTGSNGKTSTVELIARILKDAGKSFAYNKEGSNQIEGVTTLILDNCTLSGKVKPEIILIESDERFAKYTFGYFSPTHYVITNLYRDQLTRNGHPEWVYHAIEESIHPGTQLVLNADDPLVSKFGLGRENTVYFGADRLPQSTEECTSLYNDGKYCPNCKHLMEYEFYHYNHIGKFRCPNCGLHSNPTAYTVTSADLDDSSVVINEKYKLRLAFSSFYMMYNTLAAFAAASLLGVAPESIVQSVSDYTLQNGRIVRFSIGAHQGVLLASKHENSVSYDQSLRAAVSGSQPKTVVIIVDAVSRKYFTSDVSWLWDIDFELLASEKVQKIVLAGLYCGDLAVRFDYTEIPKEKITVITDIGETVSWLSENAEGEILAVTCFSDKGKFLTRVQLQP